LFERRPWESFHTTWASALADALNQDILPSGYLALEHVHAGARIEIDVATYSDGRPGEVPREGEGGTATLLHRLDARHGPDGLPRALSPQCTVEIVSTEGGRTLVAAVEIVSPGNKDREVQRRLFAAKCATYLARGVGLVVVDVVTSRRGNLHNEFAALLGLDPAHSLTPAPPLYTVAYRPLRRGEADQVEAWPTPLAVGQPLPTVPLSLSAEVCVPVDLEAAYAEACRRRRVDEALG
jgi:hypothetical protein